MFIKKRTRPINSEPQERIVEKVDEEDNEASNIPLRLFFLHRLVKHTKHLENTLERELGRLNLKQDTENHYHEGIQPSHEENNCLLTTLSTKIRQ